ncbi:hypothetical protein [Frateuria sp. Soil773]|uniref:hypothetical protein n=1 Tax=Frateuria sp. Soil773 TaxID=1736407 RepID=UPI000B09F958|nr:hypothetical protein [Frateuria sp. Soil773]
MFRANFLLFAFASSSILLFGCGKKGPDNPSGSQSTLSDESSYALAWRNRQVPVPASTVGRTVRDIFGEEVDEYPPEGVVLGQGWNRGFGTRTLNQCVVGSEQTQQGGSATIEYHYVFDSEQLQSLLSVSAHGGYGVGAFGAHASSNYTTWNTNDRTTTHILGLAHVDKGASFITDGKVPLRLTNTARAILDSDPLEGPKRFLQACGDGFVSSIRIGGQLSYLFDQRTLNNTDGKSFTLSASASGWGASGGVDITTKEIKTLAADNFDIHVFQSGGDLNIPMNMAAAISHIESYANFAPTQAVPYKIVVTPYLVVAPSANLVDTHSDDIRSLSASIARTKKLENVYNAALRDPASFYLPYSTIPDLSNDYTALSTIRRCLEQIILQCRETGECDFTALSKSTVPQLCPASALTGGRNSIAYTPEQLTRILAMLPGSDVARGSKLMEILQKQARNADAGSDGQSLARGDFGKVLKGPWTVLNNEVTWTLKSAGTPPEALRELNHAMSPDGYALTYYDYLARAPFRKDNVDWNADELGMAVALCLKRNAMQGVANGDCGSPQGFAVDTPSDNAEKSDNCSSLFCRRKNTILGWIKYGRIFPESSGACEANENGVLCADVSWLQAYVIDPLKDPVMDKTRNFNSSTSMPRPTQPRPFPRNGGICGYPDRARHCPT